MKKYLQPDRLKHAVHRNANFTLDRDTKATMEIYEKNDIETTQQNTTHTHQQFQKS